MFAILIIMEAVKSTKVRNTEHIPKSYKEFMDSEKKWIQDTIKHTSSLIDVGCGDGRLTLTLSQLTDKYVGVDLDSEALQKAKLLEHDNIKMYAADATKLSALFHEKEFETSVLLWNTIGNVGDDKKVLEEVCKVTRSKCFITGIKKGALAERKKYYDSYNADYTIDKDTETIYSNVWGISKSYSPTELGTLCQTAGFRIVNIIEFNDLAFGIELAK